MGEPGVWQFGKFELDSSERRLSRDGVAIRIQPKAYEVLLALVNRAGELVSREELLRLVWAETNVLDGNLTNCITALRKELGPLSIETVSKHGYRFRLNVVAPGGLSADATKTFAEAKTQMLKRTIDSVSEAQRLLWTAIAEQPDCAEAWAWLARASRYLEKFGIAAASNGRLAAMAFERALGLDPDLPSAHQFLTAVQVDTGKSIDAMKRLLARVAKFPNDAHSYAGLVQVCRFAGLLDASIAAHDRVVRLDPNLSTSIPHTHFARCDYKATIAAYAISGRQNRVFLDLAAWASLGANVEDELAERLNGERWPPVFRALQQSLLDALRKDAAAVKRICLECDVSQDPETALYLSRHLAHCGCMTEAIALLEVSMQGGLTIPCIFECDPWLVSLHSHTAFQRLHESAVSARHSAQEIFQAANGPKLVAVAGYATA